MPKKPTKHVPGNFAKRKSKADGKKALEKFLTKLEDEKAELTNPSQPPQAW